MAHSDAPAFGNPTINPSWTVAIIRSSWHGDITQKMADDCSARLVVLGIPKANIKEITVPGAFEIPLFCNKALTELGFDGAVAIGVILQGATHHADLIAQESARACMDIQIKAGKPVTFEILYVNSIEDARSRVLGANGKGRCAAETLLSCLAKKDELHP